MNRYLCLSCGFDFFDITGEEILCPVCGEKKYRCLGLVNEQVHPVMRPFVNLIAEPLKIHNYGFAGDRDTLDG